VARAPGDGYTLLVGTDAMMTSNIYLYKNVAFDPVNDVSPITNAGANIICLAVSSQLPVNSVAELIAYARANPGKLSFGSSGTASPHHLSGELLRQMAGIDILHVPYKGGGAAANDLLGGHIGMAFLSLSSAVPLLTTGKIKILAVVEKTRYAAMPDIPTIGETVPGFEMSSWLGFFAPAGTPNPLIARLHDEIVRVLKTDAAKEKLASLGFAVTATTPVERGEDRARPARAADEIGRDSTRVRHVMQLERIACVALAVLGLGLPPAHGDDYPTREVHVICAYAPGTGADTLVRFFAEKLRVLAGKPMIVENKPGAGTSIAAEYVARAKPDGYTLFLNPGNGMAGNVYLYKNLGHDVIKDFAPITTLVKLPFVLAVTAASPAKSVGELIALVKDKGDKSSYGAPTNLARAAGELFNERAGLKSVAVPYKSTVEAMNDLNSGFIDFVWTDATFALIGAPGQVARACGHDAEPLQP
jgi:tripartite-type tricarboxylate transporter receptor subunit TctC